MTNLELIFLGPMQVKLDDTFIEVKPRKALALLVYLAVTAERHSRDALATLLWPESSQQTARKSLRSRLSELNLALGAGWIEADRESVALRGGYWLDAADFQHLLADQGENTQTLMKATDLYRDDFIIGFTLPDSPAFDEWQFFQAEGLRQSLATALEKLIHKLSEQKEYEQAVPYGRRWLALDPLHEPAHQQLMQLYAQAGQQAAALRQYDQCLQTLEKELGIAPSQETKALYQDIQAGKFEPGKQRPRRKHNLPVQTSTFIGREDELADIKQLLVEEPGCRLLNLIGPGGVGKTRLALATAVQLLDAYPDAAFFVSLAPVSETEDIVLTIAKALNFTFYGEEDPKTQLLDYLARKAMLLVVDNFEHLLGGAHLLSEILTHAPDVTLLVTSRERLNLQEEWGYDVQGLPFPVEIEAGQPEESLLEKYSSLELFLQRARRAKARFTPSAGETADIIRICRYVDGTPLGIELAAPWVRAMSCREIADEIERNLDFLTTSMRNIPERHRSLRVVFEQTWERLSPDEQAVLKRLSIFRGGCTREAAEQVAGATLSVLASLVDKALLHRNNLGRHELHELIRQFAESKLQANPETAEQTQQNHQDYFVEFLEKRTAGVEGSRQKETIGEIKIDMDNVRLAWRRAVANKDVKAIDRSVECLYAYYIYSSSHYEGQAAFQQAVSALTVGLDPKADTVTLQNLQIQQGQENLVGYLLATQTYMLARLSGSQVVPEEVIARLLREKPGNKRREAVALSALSMGIRYQGRVIEARPYAERGLALAEDTNSAIGQWWSLTGLAIPISFSHPLKAKELLVKALAACQKSGDPSAQGFSNQNLGRTLVELGEYALAAQYIDKSLQIFTDLDNLQGLGYYYEDVGRLEVALGDYRRAIRNFHQAIEYLEETRSTLHVNHCQVWLGNAYRLNGDYQKSEETSQAMLAAFNAIEDGYHSGYCLLYLGLLAQDKGDMARAERLLKEAYATWENAELDARIAYAAHYLGHLMVAMGERHHMEAIDYFQQGLEGAVEHQMAPLALDVFVRAAHLLIDAGEMERAVELLFLAEQHEAITFETKERARSLLNGLEGQIQIGVIGKGRDRSEMDVWAVARSVSTDLNNLKAALTLPSGLQKPHHNLPVQTTTFIGREKEVAGIKQMLLEENDCRLLTLVGPGGIGKTRLALATAVQLRQGFKDGVYFIPLAPVSEPELMVQAIAESLRLTFYSKVEPKAQLLDYLKRRQLLLIFDNVEHLLAGTTLLSEIISQAPDISILATSRERLNLQEEWLFEVRGLEIPADDRLSLDTYSAIELFLQRARQANAGFSATEADAADIIHICQLVEGMPLAIELAAPWIKVLSCREIAAEIERSLDILETTVSNVPDRHRSLRMVFEQTWERLTEQEKSVLTQLSVFRGGCTREAAEEVTGATLPLLSSLVDRALVRRNNAGRYELHELIRQFANIQLKAESDAPQQTQQQHRNYFLSFLEKRTAGLKEASQKEVINEIKADMDNVRLAWQRAVNNRDAEAIERSAECLFIHYTYSSGHFEGQVAFEQAVDAFTAVPASQEDSVDQQPLVILDERENLVGFLLAIQAYFLARISGEQLISEDFIVQLLGTRPGEMRKKSIALAFLSAALHYQGRIADSISYAESGLPLASETGESFGEWVCLLQLGSLAIDNHPIKAEQYLNRALSVCQRSGDPSALGWTCKNLAVVSVELGKYKKAKRLIDQGIKAFESVESNQGLGDTYEGAGILAMAVGDYNGSIQNFRKALAYFNETQSTLHVNQVRVWMGYAFRLLGNHKQAEQFSRQSLNFFTALDDPLNVSYCLINLGCLAQDRGELVQAEKSQREALDILIPFGLDVRTAEALLHLGSLLIDIDTRHHDEARQKLLRALRLALEYQVAPLALGVCVEIAYLLTHINVMERAVELLVLTGQHKASTFETKKRARHLLAELGEQLPKGKFEATQTQGRQIELWAATQELLDEMARLE